jgi:tetratricopeptide (TPR) repeat protein
MAVQNLSIFSISYRDLKVAPARINSCPVTCRAVPEHFSATCKLVPCYLCSTRKTRYLLLVYRTILLSICFVSAFSAHAQQSKETDGRIQFLQTRVAADPDSYMNYNRLASAYLQKARESGDLTYYDLAEQAVHKSLELESSHSEAASTFDLLSTVDFSKHNFKQAIEAAEKALKLDSRELGAAVSAGDACVEMGDYEKARKYYSELDTSRHSQRASVLYLKLTRQAGFALGLANLPDAVLPLQEAVKISNGTHLPAENVAWTHFTLGETYLQLGNFINAEKAFNASLESFPGYHRAYAGMAQLRAAQKRYNEAIGFYQKAISVIPLPVYAAALGDVYSKVGKTREAEQQYKLVEYIAALSVLSKNVYNRELATFYADHDRNLPAALELARRELEVRHNLYTQDALAWVLFKNGKTEEAINSIQSFEDSKLRDPVVLYHLGMIYRGAGDQQRSRDYLKRALAINPEFHIFYADRARQLLKPPDTLKAEGAKRAR